MWRFLCERMRMFGDSTLKDQDKRYPYSLFVKMAEEHGCKLKTALPPHAKCAVLCDSGLHTALAILSCWYAKLVPIPMSKHYGERHCSAIRELTEPDCIICDSVFHDSDALTYRIDLGEFTRNAPIFAPEADLRDVALIMCTSGTTGKPKGAMITVDGLQANILAISDYFALNRSDTILIARPLYHCAVLTGELLISLYLGLNICFYDEKYNPSNVIGLCDRFRITVLCGTPTLFRQISLLSKRTKIKLPLRVVALSGECLTREVAVQIREALPETILYHVYGLTEAAPRVAYLPPDQFDSMPEFVGLPLKNTQIKIVDCETFRERSPKTAGVVIINAPSLMKGYYRNPERTAQVFRDGWLNTGDVGFLDEDGYLQILARTDDMIIKAGMNMYPKEIENAISTLPEISDVVAYGVKAQTGQEIAVHVVLSNGYENTTVKQLLHAFTGVLPNHQMPAQVHIVAALERNSSGKLVRPRANS